jgi:hypothetical protein
MSHVICHSAFVFGRISITWFFISTIFIRELFTPANKVFQHISYNILHLDRIAKAIVFRCSYTERLSLLLFANSNSRSILYVRIRFGIGNVIGIIRYLKGFETRIYIKANINCIIQISNDIIMPYHGIIMPCFLINYFHILVKFIG